MLLKYIRYTLTKFSLELSIRLQYLYYFHKPIHLKKPKTLDEKIQWMKLNLYGKDPIYTQCADKLLVRKYVESVGCGSILNKLIAVYKDPKEIEWESLPNKFVIKWNFGNGYNIICSDKKKLNIHETIKQLLEWGRQEAWLKTGEIQYRYIPKRILIEEFIEDGRGQVPIDYKIYCFHGEPKYMFVCVGREKEKTKFYFFDKEWNLARINPDSQKASVGFSLPRPKHLDEMFDIATRLSQRFPFVRVDLYDTPEQIYFGELTFTPGGGFDTGRLPETQILLGKLLHIQ
ncbi:hypothetical protein HR11_08545 [Porphyromonas macacae]|uniref:ATP-grasp fold amidoligase family protein n=1 Tax=Porphyromonas macacae TaxID=28115 RepID=UPI00052BE140|nr:ATP-grasp fold amidoligase family protein [Porphyromonas macacae]KGN98571.1 hypothetical protein HR11_08545 [Porphyromonas macacae]